jgi:Zn-dependent protease with chaperone function
MIQTPELFHEHFFLIALFVLVLGALGLSMRLMSTVDEKGVSDPDHDLSKLYLVTGSVFGYVLLWLFLHQALEEGTATMIALALYTVAGIAAYLSGREYASKGLRVYGGVLLGFVVGHLLLVDVWQMELFFRIITFFVIGALLMATAFVGRKRKESAV